MYLKKYIYDYVSTNIISIICQIRNNVVFNIISDEYFNFNGF